MEMINANCTKNIIDVHLTKDETKEQVLKKYHKVDTHPQNMRKQKTYKNKH